MRDAVARRSTLPLVFWDEFDTPLAGQPLGWLRHFLAPMQDGAFREGGGFHPLGPAIFVFAGGTCPTLAGVRGRRRRRRDRQAKKPDFLSRLRGYVDVLGPNPRDADDARLPLRRALLLRALLQQQGAADARRRTGAMASIDDGVAARLLCAPPTSPHGARSMEAIIDMSSLAGKLRLRALAPAAAAAARPARRRRRVPLAGRRLRAGHCATTR